MRNATWALLLAAGCSAAQPPPTGPSPEPAAVQAAGPDEARILEELVRERSVAEQQAILGSQRRYELALAWFDKGDFEKAKVEAREAVRLWPEHLAARKLLAQIYELIAGSPPGGIFEHDVRHAMVAVEQAQVEITTHMIHGERYLGARMYESAAREFESALLKLQFIPADVKAMNDLRPKAKEMLLRSRNAAR
jgi:tetratricopeptide (TPR) repeat protein